MTYPRSIDKSGLQSGPKAKSPVSGMEPCFTLATPSGVPFKIQRLYYSPGAAEGKSPPASGSGTELAGEGDTAMTQS